MLGFGLLIGLMFPFVAVLLGVARDIALRPSFFIATLIAGLVVAEDNHLLARDVVGARLQSLVGGMQHVEASLVDASSSSEWAGYDLAACTVAVDSTDELGDVAASFNRLVAGLSTSHWVSDGVKSLSQVLAAHLELGALAEATLRELSIRTGCDAAGLVVASNGRVEVAGSSGIRDAERLASVETVLTALRTGQPTVLRLPVDVVSAGHWSTSSRRRPRPGFTALIDARVETGSVSPRADSTASATVTVNPAGSHISARPSVREYPAERSARSRPSVLRSEWLSGGLDHAVQSLVVRAAHTDTATARAFRVTFRARTSWGTTSTRSPATP